MLWWYVKSEEDLRDIVLDIGSLPQLFGECETRVLPLGAKVEDYLSPWSKTKVSLPVAVMVHAKEEDIKAVSNYVASQGLRVLREVSAHGAFSLSKSIDLTTVWPAHQIEEIHRPKVLCNAKEVFWNPIVDGA